MSVCRTFQAKVIVAWMLIVSPMVVVAASPQIPLELLSIEGVRSFVNANHIDTVEAFMDAMPPVLLSNYVLMETSHSRQKPSTVLTPRIILFLPNGSFFMGIATDSRATGYNDLEILEQRADRTWQLDAIKLEAGHDAIRHSGGAAFGERFDCKGCHGIQSRPIWGSYHDWPGAFGNLPGQQLGVPQANALNSMLTPNGAQANVRLQKLNWLKTSGWSENDQFSIPDRARNLGLEAMNDAVAIAHAKTLWQRVNLAPNFELYLLTHLFAPATFCANTPGVPDVRTRLIAIVEAEWQQTGRNFPQATPSDKALMLLGLGLYNDLNLSKSLPELQVDPESDQYYFGRRWQGVSALLGDLISFRYLDHIVAEYPEYPFAALLAVSPFEGVGDYPNVDAFRRAVARYMRELTLTEQIELLKTEMQPSVDVRESWIFTATVQEKIGPSLVELAKRKIAEYEHAKKTKSRK